MDGAIQRMYASGRTDATAISSLTDALIGSLDTSGGAPVHAYDRALASLAEQHFCAASWLGWIDATSPARVAQTWKAAQAWKLLDRGRFGVDADLFTERLRRRYGDEIADKVTELGPSQLDTAARLVEDTVRADRAGSPAPRPVTV